MRPGPFQSVVGLTFKLVDDQIRIDVQRLCGLACIRLKFDDEKEKILHRVTTQVIVATRNAQRHSYDIQLSSR